MNFQDIFSGIQRGVSSFFQGANQGVQSLFTPAPQDTTTQRSEARNFTPAPFQPTAGGFSPAPSFTPAPQQTLLPPTTTISEPDTNQLGQATSTDLVIPEDRTPQADNAISNLQSKLAEIKKSAEAIKSQIPEIEDFEPTETKQDREVPTLQREISDLKTTIEKARQESAKALSAKKEAGEDFSEREALESEFERFKIPENFQAIQDITEQILPLRQELADLERQEQEALLIASSDPGLQPTINREKEKIQREFATKKQAVAAQIQALSAHQQALAGNVQLGAKLAALAVDASVADFEREVNFYDDFIEFNKDFIDSLDEDLQDSLDRARELADDQLVQERRDREFVMGLATDPRFAPALVGQDLTQITPEDAAQLAGDFAGIPPPKTEQVGQRVYQWNSQRGQWELAIEGAPAGGVLIPGESELSQAFNNAIAFAGVGFTEAQRESIPIQFSQMVQSGNVEGAKEFLLRIAHEGASAAQYDRVQGRNEAIVNLTFIRGALEKFAEAGGDTGFFTGSLESIAEKVGKTTDPELARIANDIRIAIQDYRRAVSGAAFTIPESAEYERIFPSIGKVSELNTAKIDSIIQTFARNQDTFYRSVIGPQNYDSLFGSEPEPTSLNETLSLLTASSVPLGGEEQILAQLIANPGQFSLTREDLRELGLVE